MPLILSGSGTIGTSGNAGISIDNTGRVRTSFQPAFFAAMTGGWTHPSGVQLVLGTWATTFNIGSCYNTSTRRFTAPVTGAYQFNGTVATTGGVGTFSYLSCEFWVNGSRRSVGGWGGGGPSYGQTCNTAILFLNANDYIELGCESNKTFAFEASSQHTTFSGYLVG